VLAYAMGLSEARGGLLAWATTDEPQPRLAADGTARLPAQPIALLPDADVPMLFDRARDRRLCLMPTGRLVAGKAEAWPALVATENDDTGLSIPLAGRTGRGQLVLHGMPGLNADDLFLAQSLAREVTAALDDEEARAMAREVSMARLRGQIATDLHDSVVQTLAGTRFRLEALRLGQSPADPQARDIAEICDSIAGEQNHVRAIIAQLRQGQILPGRRDLHAELAALARQLARHWAVTITLAPAASPCPCPPCCFTNASIWCARRWPMPFATVRPARSRSIWPARGGALRLAITDDGQGFPAHRPIPCPPRWPRALPRWAGLLRWKPVRARRGCSSPCRWTCHDPPSRCRRSCVPARRAGAGAGRLGHEIVASVADGQGRAPRHCRHPPRSRDPRFAHARTRWRGRALRCARRAMPRRC
jgi:hypothetical protein